MIFTDRVSDFVVVILGPKIDSHRGRSSTGTSLPLPDISSIFKPRTYIRDMSSDNQSDISSKVGKDRESGVKYDIVHMLDQSFSKQPLNEFGSLPKNDP